jgi:hypothetical protein
VHSTCGDSDEATVGKAWLVVLPAFQVARQAFDTRVTPPRESERALFSISRAPPTKPPKSNLV